MPYRGRCGLCGSSDARHREWDAWRVRHHAGESVRRIAVDVDRPEALVRAVVALSPHAYNTLMRGGTT